MCATLQFIPTRVKISVYFFFSSVLSHFAALNSLRPSEARFSIVITGVTYGTHLTVLQTEAAYIKSEAAITVSVELIVYKYTDFSF